MNITVKEIVGGWVVVGGETMGPFSSKARALDLAEGIVAALQQFGEKAELVLEDRSQVDCGAPFRVRCPVAQQSHL